MDLSTVMSVAQTLFAALENQQLKEMCSLFGYKSELEDLKRTVSTVKAVLKDAEAKQELSHQAQLYIDELKDAVYHADDLLDEFVTLVEQQALTEGNRVSKKVRVLFSRFNDLSVARKMSKGVKKIRKKLDDIASNYDKFGFKVDYQPVKFRREETCSYVNSSDIIGRDTDVDKIIDMLHDSDAQGNVSFLSIVGIGGLGKTALSQLLYNDPRVKDEFSTRMWVCVSDQHQNQLDVKALLEKILCSATDGNTQGSSTMDLVQRHLHKHLKANKFLLVLDDVWTEDREEWLKLERFLKEGHTGSCVVVTTRSKLTARIVGSGFMYELQGLSQDDSWRLFHMIAFQQANPPHDLVEIGRHIVKKCVNVPLAIRVVGSLLYGQGKSKWCLFEEKGLAKISGSENGITPILMFSYHHLQPTLKSCFAYCAIFPKSSPISKQLLLWLWTAQGCIVPFEEGQSLEEAAEEYFLILLRRCFFQDVSRNTCGEVITCKIHDLMHDIAQNVAGKEIICMVNPYCVELDERVRHMAVVNQKDNLMVRFQTRTQLRTYGLVWEGINERLISSLLTDCLCLRALLLRGSSLKMLPESLGNLLHLRYLDLAHNFALKALPMSITKLHNLQILNLCGCYSLKELPKDIFKLQKLEELHLYKCDELLNLPPGITKLNCLARLDKFLVGSPNSSEKTKECYDQLENLRALGNLKGSLDIQIRVPKNATYKKENIKTGAGAGAYLEAKEHLNSIGITFTTNMENSGGVKFQEELLEELQPHTNVKEFGLIGWRGTRMPSWATKDKFLPNLVQLRLDNCEGLQCLPWLGGLRHLKVLILEKLPKLEYVVNETLKPAGSSSSSGQADHVLTLFPCLEEIVLKELPELKGWWGTSGKSYKCDTLQVQKLDIFCCPKLTSFPLCPNVKCVRIFDCTNSRNGYDSCSHIKGLSEGMATDDLNQLKRLMSMLGFPHIKMLGIFGDEELERLSEVNEDFFWSNMSFLRKLEISKCPKLSSLYGVVEHLTALEELIFDCPNLVINNNDQHPQGKEELQGVPWRCLSHTLRVLRIGLFPQMEYLPEDMQYLTSLKDLVIIKCPRLHFLPSWMPQLTSLNTLQLLECSDQLKERCQKPNGEDWHKIQHIPRIFFHL